ncbi:hypothetical protein MMC14_010552 [Varicellaria rhodocarpa]|nr:hypothetical protein [Varicellaria rhodocarpa]
MLSSTLITLVFLVSSSTLVHSIPITPERHSDVEIRNALDSHSTALAEGNLPYQQLADDVQRNHIPFTGDIEPADIPSTEETLSLDSPEASSSTSSIKTFLPKNTLSPPSKAGNHHFHSEVSHAERRFANLNPRLCAPGRKAGTQLKGQKDYRPCPLIQ